MTLGHLKNHISKFPSGTIFKYALSNPFSWRGSYDEVAFAIFTTEMSREELLERIEIAYKVTFTGYKGGEYNYDDHTTVNFEEEGSKNYSSGGYTSAMINLIEKLPQYASQEERLMNLAFRN